MEVRYVGRMSNSQWRNQRVYPRVPREILDCAECKRRHSVGQESSGSVIRYGRIVDHSVECAEYLDVQPCVQHQSAAQTSADHIYE